MPLDSALTKYGAFRPGVCTSSTRPANPAEGQTIYQTDTDETLVYHGSTWGAVQPRTGFKNFIINGDFRVNQRGWSSSTSSSTYGFDRWRSGNNGGTVTMSSQTFTVGSPAETGYEAANFLRLVSASQSLVGHYASVAQVVEDVRTFADTTVVVSFWAKAASGTPKVAVDFTQAFGTGGTPSADINTYAGQVTLSTSWARYSVSVVIPSISGKTIGTNANTSGLVMNLWTSAGSDFNSRTGSLGIQNNTFDFWGVQLERGYTPTTFEQRPLGQELLLCKRYFERVNRRTWGVFTTSGSTARIMVQTSVPMRVAPVPSLTTTSLDTEYWSVAQLTTSGSSITSYSGGPEGLDLTINGWTSRTGGTAAMIKENQINLNAEY